MLHTFEHWLIGDDVLLWWYESGADFYKKLCEDHNIHCPQMGVMNKIVHPNYKLPEIKGNNFYRLAKAMLLQIPEIEHYSVNDVTVLHRLLSSCGIQFDQSGLL